MIILNNSNIIVYMENDKQKKKNQGPNGGVLETR